jgi:hypothetical protein
MRSLVPVLVAAAFCAGSARAENASWDEQNTAMSWFIMHISGINALNGLNLTRDQAVRLRALARDVESAAPKPPAFNRAFRPDLGEVRDTYLELRKVLLDGGEVSKELEAKVGRARGIDAAVIRSSLARPNEKGANCQRCHGEPDTNDVRAQTAAALTDVRMSDKPNQRETFMAHMQGTLGARGSVKVAQLAPEVDKLLTDPQKEVVRTFSCCLVPPKGLSDPVRAGQAAGGNKEVEILRHVRGIPADRWPQVREAAMRKLDQIVAVKSPGATETERAEARERVAEVYEKARAMSETDFEMEKDRLAADLHGKKAASASPDASGQRFMAAYFLLLPGSAEVYDRLLQRLEAKKTASNP